MKISKPAVAVAWGLALCAVLSGPVRAAEPAQVQVPAGQAVFERQCVACHQAGGKGMAGFAPALAGTLAHAFETEDGRRYVTWVLLNGLSGRILSQGQTFTGAMASQAALSDAELADVGNHLARDLNGAATAPFTAEDFARARVKTVPHKEIRELRARLAP
ncbi:c-type cytochrome [Roseateles koreensis]|uniref:Cytochrome c n=1 Tax=Roseateles koreensis TaxID=2987526 RepID=A0ABT5KVB3_9BURK|nr:cytochrome c [Roseateles koreensis]MDC8786385.1 cytochrome c [Roseateles koreensis]